jgi:hypothetical protein
MNYCLNAGSASPGHRIFQHVFKNGAYQTPWMSGRFPGMSSDTAGAGSARIGDLDNDGVREAIASVYYLARKEKVKGTNVEYYNFRILGYRNGCEYDCLPDFQSPPLGEMAGMIINDSIIADVDSGGSPGIPHNELVLARSAKVSQIDICRMSGDIWSMEHVANLDNYLFSVDAGDVDGDGRNEIVAVSQGAPYPVVFKYDAGIWLKVLPDPAPTYVYAAKARDADHDGIKEIIAYGGNGRLMVWKHVQGRYKLDFIGDYVGVSSLRGIDADDFNGNGNSEILLAAGGDKKTEPRVLKYSYDESTGRYLMTASYPLAVSVNELVLGNLDGAPGAEVGFGCYPSGVRLFGFIDGNLIPVYSAPSSMSGKIEIR